MGIGYEEEDIERKSLRSHPVASSGINNEKHLGYTAK
jgi:hypothetical protein